MSIKSILVVVSGAEDTNPALALAFTLGRTYSAHIAALYVKPVVMVYSDGMGFDMTPSVIEAQQAYLQAAADKAESVTKAQAAKARVDIEWRCEEGDELSVASSHARVSDIVLASPDVARDLMFESGVPVLAVPHGASDQIAKRVLVAWNGSRESARAVRDAKSFLTSSEQVIVAVFDPPHGKGMGHDLAALLAHHGQVALGASLDQALRLAIEVETLARMYLQACQLGEPPCLSIEQMQAVQQQFRALLYGAG